MLGLNGVEPSEWVVSMESGLEDRNNFLVSRKKDPLWDVSMESGLEDRNNMQPSVPRTKQKGVSQWSPA